MKVSDYYGSNWLSNKDLEEDEVYVVTVEDCYEEELKHDDEEGNGRSDTKIAVKFVEFDKALLLNKINATTIAAIWGEDTDDWIGNVIAIYVTDVEYKGKQVPAIRVKSRAPKEKPRPKAARKRSSKAAKRTSKRGGTKRRRPAEDEYDEE